MKKSLLANSFLILLLALTGCNSQTNTSKDHQLKAEAANAELNDENNEATNKLKSDTTEIIKDDRKGIVPVSIKIPAINVKTKVEHVGTLDDGRMDVPKDAANVGWYEPGTLPGAPGNSVIAGHVDDLTSPAVFYDLHKLKDGDEIIVTGKSGESLTFIVNTSKVYPRQNAPIENIFGFSYRSVVNLITCTGEYDPRTTERAERLVVSAELHQKKD
ncbi:class F sortase [Pseudalkalibacillus sp. SCS-8]|uniref:class F sortase n=1 Tax=Pseudalkalibacillus nanhaiensis TaxID=3115291 RepID=UPI0032DBED79